METEKIIKSRITKTKRSLERNNLYFGTIRLLLFRKARNGVFGDPVVAVRLVKESK